MIKRSVVLIGSLFILYLVWKYGNQERELVLAFISAFVGGLFTLFGVNITLKHTQAINYGRFYLKFNKAQIHINRFIRKSKLISDKLGGFDRPQVRSMLVRHELVVLKQEIEKTIYSLNRDLMSIDFKELDEIILDINENSPIEYYKELNSIIYSMISIYNSLIYDGKYLIENVPEPLLYGLTLKKRTEIPHHKQIRILEKLYKKMCKEMKVK